MNVKSQVLDPFKLADKPLVNPPECLKPFDTGRELGPVNLQSANLLLLRYVQGSEQFSKRERVCEDEGVGATEIVWHPS